MHALLDFLINGDWHHRLARWLLSYLAVVVLVSVTATLIGIRMIAGLHFRWRERCILRRVCARCGYDLRSTRHRCPECGWIMPNDPPLPPIRAAR